MTYIEIYEKAINRLCKWRTVFTGWQLGTRSMEDPEAQAVRDATDARLVLRVDTSAIVNLLIEKGIFTEEEFCNASVKETEELHKMLENKFPGFKATDSGITADVAKAAETTKNWRK